MRAAKVLRLNIPYYVVEYEDTGAVDNVHNYSGGSVRPKQRVVIETDSLKRRAIVGVAKATPEKTDDPEGAYRKAKVLSASLGSAVVQFEDIGTTANVSNNTKSRVEPQARVLVGTDDQGKAVLVGKKR